MATYLELRNLFNDNDLNLRVQTAVIVAASNLLDGTPTAKDRAFVDLAYSNNVSISKKVLMFVLAENKAASVSQIQDATDTAIQDNVDAVIPSLVDALAGV